MANYCRASGLKAVAVNLSITRDVGAIAESAGVGNTLSQWEDVIGIHVPAFHVRQREGDGAEGVDDPCPAQVYTGLGSEALISAHSLSLPYYFADMRLGPLAVRTNVATKAAIASKLGELLASRLTEVMLDVLVCKIADMLQIPASEVDPNWYQYCVDSLLALQVCNWITRELKSNFALLEILAAVPLPVFAAKMAEKSKPIAGLE